MKNLINGIKIYFKLASLDIDIRDNEIAFIITQYGIISAFQLDRNQAHLLMLYLQEHLDLECKIPEDYWYCKSCRTLHSKDYICERIKK